MAWGTYCWVLMGLLGVRCEVTNPADKLCTELIANRSYTCEGLGLTEIPGKLPFTTKELDFSFNLLYSLQHSMFGKLTDLVYLDLTRCQINWVYDGAFESNLHLEAIVLTGNNLLFLAYTAFKGPRFLKHLDLTQTGLTSLKFIPMQGLDNLETLLLGIFLTLLNLLKITACAKWLKEKHFKSFIMERQRKRTKSWKPQMIGYGDGQTGIPGESTSLSLEMSTQP
ncbi:CD180 antigen isoform X2 [Varanus komodoensis]|uniref:CD180 antigen isoform X2 n=1 Tax=Varanus komodoensis TaxID=61221 RepID=UPI001CF7BB1C|nr:CD180 antigen isoform X2 [Varanus komodoensis]